MENTSYDINKLPSEQGIFFMGISMSRIGNMQSPQKCYEYLEHLDSKIQYTEGIAMEVWYGDYLYLHSDDPAYQLRDRFKEQMFSHKNGFLKLLKKTNKWTLKAFTFKTFGQILLENSDIYANVFTAVLELYKNDAKFRECVLFDCEHAGHGLGEREALFILEEITMFYLEQKGEFRLNNTFVTDTEKNWTLQVYPGKPLKSEVYLFQKNPLGFSKQKNRYENCYYDLEGKILYDYTKIDINTFNFD